MNNMLYGHNLNFSDVSDPKNIMNYLTNMAMNNNIPIINNTQKMKIHLEKMNIDPQYLTQKILDDNKNVVNVQPPSTTHTTPPTLIHPSPLPPPKDINDCVVIYKKFIKYVDVVTKFKTLFDAYNARTPSGSYKYTLDDLSTDADNVLSIIFDKDYNYHITDAFKTMKSYFDGMSVIDNSIITTRPTIPDQADVYDFYNNIYKLVDTAGVSTLKTIYKNVTITVSDDIARANLKHNNVNKNLDDIIKEIRDDITTGKKSTYKKSDDVVGKLDSVINDINKILDDTVVYPITIDVKTTKLYSIQKIMEKTPLNTPHTKIYNDLYKLISDVISIINKRSNIILKFNIAYTPLYIYLEKAPFEIEYDSSKNSRATKL